MRTVRYINAVISAQAGNGTDIETVRGWLERWDDEILQRFEALRHGREIYDLILPEHCIRELPLHFVERTSYAKSLKTTEHVVASTQKTLQKAYTPTSKAVNS